ncbi:MAG: SBBP repeat-containing protein, partial [Planctomycetota bacterium]
MSRRINIVLVLGTLTVLLPAAQGQEMIEAWVTRYNGPGNGSDAAYALALDDSGNIFVTGWSSGSGTGTDYATIKYNADGTELWEARYNGSVNGGDWAVALTLDDSGNVYVTGSSEGIGTSTDYATIKYDPAGTELWVARYNGPGNGYDNAQALALDESGNIYVTGESEGSGTSNDYATVKYDPDGNELWVTRYDGPGNDYDVANALDVDNSGNVYVTGQSFEFLSDYATIKYDPDGNELWVARYNGPWYSNDDAIDLAVDNSGNVYVTGQSYGVGTLWDYATIKYDTDGNELWVILYNGPVNGGDGAAAIALDDSGNIYVTGESDTGGVTACDYATIKYDPAGNELWVTRYQGPGTDYAKALALDNSGNV